MWRVLGFYVNFSLHMVYVILNVNALLERVKYLTLSSQPKSHSTWLLVIGLNSCPSSKFEIFFKKDHHLKKKKKISCTLQNIHNLYQHEIYSSIKI